MYLRLAFSVAAHLEPEILLVDEVLAVGDAAFQKKCMGKMSDVGQQGRTVLFVSHSMAAVKQLCQRAILIDQGAIALDGPAIDVTAAYLQSFPMALSFESLERMIQQLPADPAFRLRQVRLSQEGVSVLSTVSNGQPLEIEIRYQVLQRTTGLRVFFDLYDNEEILLFRSFHDEQASGIPVMEPGEYVSKAVVPADLLAPTPYELRIYATVFNVRLCIPGMGIRIPISVERAGRANSAYVSDPIRGRLAPTIAWTTVEVRSGSE
jgi:lipopolysaccharide transport system ATP-binding protein